MDSGQQNDILCINQVQLLLAEKRTALAVMRTALAVMRTGIAVLALPLSVFSALIATSKWYRAAEVWPLLVLVVLISTGLVAFAVYLIARSAAAMHRYDRIIRSIKENHAPLHTLIR